MIKCKIFGYLNLSISLLNRESYVNKLYRYLYVVAGMNQKLTKNKEWGKEIKICQNK